jgi:hypothetical protein
MHLVLLMKDLRRALALTAPGGCLRGRGLTVQVAVTVAASIDGHGRRQLASP